MFDGDQMTTVVFTAVLNFQTVTSVIKKWCNWLFRNVTCFWCLPPVMISIFDKVWAVTCQNLTKQFLVSKCQAFCSGPLFTILTFERSFIVRRVGLELYCPMISSWHLYPLWVLRYGCLCGFDLFSHHDLDTSTLPSQKSAVPCYYMHEYTVYVWRR